MHMASLHRGRALGVLTLADPHEPPPPPPPHFFDDAEWFPYPTVYRVVPGATAREVVAGNPALAQAYAATARELEAEGIVAITANCGYAIAYQHAVRNAVSIPVACSSLMLLPLIRAMLPDGGRIGLLCFDAPRLTRDHLARAGVAENLPLAIGGIENTASWRNWLGPTTRSDWAALETDVMSAAERLLSANPDVTHWLLECAGFPRLRRILKAQSGRPVFDWVSLCNHLMECAPLRQRIT